MALEDKYKQIRKGLKTNGEGINQNNSTAGKVFLDYEEILNIVRKRLNSFLMSSDKVGEDNTNLEKDKNYLRAKMKESSILIETIVENEKIRMRDTTTSQLVYLLMQDFSGYSVLASAFEDDSVTDIYCMSYDNIYIEKNGKNEKYPYTFRSPESYKAFVERLLRSSGGKELNKGENKIVDFDLYGDRYNVINDVVSPKGITMTIRKHSESHVTLNQMVQQGVFNQELADFLGILLTGESNLIYAGITGSGKTTTLRALLDYYVSKVNKRILVCEDTRELFLENDHTVEMVTVKGSKGADNDATSITLQDLIISALRMKPKYIVVGEVRGVEAETAVEAMATGHSTVFSMHAGEPIDAVNRLITKYLQSMPSLGVDVVERIIGSALDYIAIQDDIPGIGRRCTSITEVSYDYTNRRVSLTPIMKFDFSTKSFKYLNNISNERVEKLLRRGITQEQIDKYIKKDISSPFSSRLNQIKSKQSLENTPSNEDVDYYEDIDEEVYEDDEY